MSLIEDEKMNEELRKKIPKKIMIHGVEGKLHNAGTFFSDGSFKTYIEYKFETKELHEKILGKKIKGKKHD